MSDLQTNQMFQESNIFASQYLKTLKTTWQLTKYAS